jgi:hypothetical protein
MKGVLAALVAVALTSCSADDPKLKGAAAEPAATPSPTAASAGSNVAESRHRFRAARERLLSSTDTSIEFRYDVRVDDEVAARTQGTAYLDREEWATETVSKVPGRYKTYVWHAVSSAGRTWMQMDAWKPPISGCWLQMGPRELPLGVTGLLPGIPAYLALPKAMRVDGYLDTPASMPATLRLDLAVTLVPNRILEQLRGGVSRKRMRGQEVQLVVHLEGSRLDGYEMAGSDFRRAWAYAGGSISPEAAQALTHVEFRVRFPQHQKARRVHVPDAPQIFTADQRGCREPGETKQT